MGREGGVGVRAVCMSDWGCVGSGAGGQTCVKAGMGTADRVDTATRLPTARHNPPRALPPR